MGHAFGDAAGGFNLFAAVTGTRWRNPGYLVGRSARGGMPSVCQIGKTLNNVKARTSPLTRSFPAVRVLTRLSSRVDREKMTGTSAMKGGGQVFLGHAWEVDKPQRP